MSMPTFGRYRADAHLGEGRYSAVYAAVDSKVGREVAVKVLSSPAATKDMQRRFEQGVRAASTLCHPNLVEVYAQGRTTEGQSYAVTERLDGAHLGQLLTTYGRLTEAVTVAVGIELAAALQHIHLAGMLHGSLRPKSVFVCGGRLVVTDFGEGRSLARSFPTPYIAPEQLSHASFDERADWFAFGSILYALLAGAPPYAGDTAEALTAAHGAGPVAPIDELISGISPEVCEVLKTCLHRDRGERPSSAHEVVPLLRQILRRQGFRDARDVLAHFQVRPEAYSDEPEDGSGSGSGSAPFSATDTLPLHGRGPRGSRPRSTGPATTTDVAPKPSAVQLPGSGAGIGATNDGALAPTAGLDDDPSQPQASWAPRPRGRTTPTAWSDPSAGPSLAQWLPYALVLASFLAGAAMWWWGR